MAAVVPTLIAYVRSALPALPGSLNKWLQDEDTKIQTSINSLIVAIENLQTRVAALESKSGS